MSCIAICEPPAHATTRLTRECVRRRRHRAAVSASHRGAGLAPWGVTLPGRAATMPDATMQEPTDIVMLTHNRLDHLDPTVDALEAAPPRPYRLTIVDNASGPEVRNWLEENRSRLHQLILLAENLYPGSSGPALQIGIDATTSDIVVATDPDLVVPDLSPCWLTRCSGILDRHPDFGILGIGLDQSNLPSVQEPENLSPEEIVDGEIVQQPVGSIFTFIRRAAMPATTTTGGLARAWRVPATASAGR